MSVKPTLQLGDRKLKQKNKAVLDFASPKTSQIIRDLKDTMYKNDIIGMAAPQIGENYRIFITEPRETYARAADQTDILRVYINPEIIEQSKEQIIIYEGCGSVLTGNLFGPVSRPKWIVVRAFDEQGKEFNFKADGILGRVIQHEMDHLNGIEYIEKVTNNTELMTEEHYIDQVKSADWHKENCRITVKEYVEVTD